MPFIALVVIGAAAGLIATRLMRIDSDLPTTIAIGVFGALLGGLILRAIVTIGGWLSGFVGAVLGAMLIIWLWQQLRHRR